MYEMAFLTFSLLEANKSGLSGNDYWTLLLLYLMIVGTKKTHLLAATANK